MSLAAQDSGFTIVPLSDVMGAEIVGLDVGQPFDTETLATIRDAFQTYHVLCFRDQHLTDDQMVAFSTQFGPLEEFPEKDHTKRQDRGLSRRQREFAGRAFTGGRPYRGLPA